MVVIMDRNEVKDIAELEVRQYFDHFLQETLPCILEKHTTVCPHGQRVARWKWMVAGILTFFTCTGSAYGIVRVIQAIS